MALDALHGSLLTAAGYGLLTLSMLASAIGVVRMRAWGIFLGGLTSLLALLTALFVRGAEGVALAIIASPALVLHVLPILLARRRGAAGNVRVAPDATYEPALTLPTARVRIASEPEDEDEDHDEAPRAALRRAESSLQA